MDGLEQWRVLYHPKPHDALQGTSFRPSVIYTYTDETLQDSQEQKALLKKAVQEGKMEQVFFRLNALGATPWRINRRLFDVVLQVRAHPVPSHPHPPTPSLFYHPHL